MTSIGAEFLLALIRQKAFRWYDFWILDGKPNPAFGNELIPPVLRVMKPILKTITAENFTQAENLVSEKQKTTAEFGGACALPSSSAECDLWAQLADGLQEQKFRHL